MKFFVTLLGFCAFNFDTLLCENRLTNCRPNEVFSECGNLCEDTCLNSCDKSQVLPFRRMSMATNVECARGCYCASGFIRNDSGNCVLNQPGVCRDDKRCASVSPNAIYKRCSYGLTPACFGRVINFQLFSAYTGRCECMPGYSMNLEHKCIETTSDSCGDESDRVGELYYLTTPDDC